MIHLLAQVTDATQGGAIGGLDVAVWAGLAAALIPVVAAFADKTKTRASIAAVATIILAALHVAAAGDVSFQTMVVAAFQALVVELSTYQAIWKPIVGLNQKVGTAIGNDTQ